MKHRNFFYRKNADKPQNKVLTNRHLYAYLSVLAVQWFRCETDTNIIQAEIHEMEADFQNIQTNATRVIIHT